MTVQSIAEVRTNFVEADFWIVRKGSGSEVGKPVEFFREQYIGVKVLRTDLVVPKYLYYVFVYIHMKGWFEMIAKGTLSLKHITVSDVKSVRLG